MTHLLTKMLLTNLVKIILKSNLKVNNLSVFDLPDLSQFFVFYFTEKLLLKEDETANKTFFRVRKRKEKSLRCFVTFGSQIFSPDANEFIFLISFSAHSKDYFFFCEEKNFV